jgi:hypothetical protein
MPDLLRFDAPVDIQAASADGKGPRFSAVAYSGGAMHVRGYGAVAIDLAGADISGTIPVLADHAENLDGLVGQGVAEIREGRILIAGVLTDATVAGAKVIALGKSGIKLQASVGFAPGTVENIGPGKVVRVNKRQLTAPAVGLTVIRSGKLREVSLLALGADSETSVAISAKGKRMSDEHENANLETTPGGPVQAAWDKPGLSSAERITLRWNAAKFHEANIRQQMEPAFHAALSGTIDFGDFERELLKAQVRDLELKAIRAERPAPPGIHGSGRDMPGGDPTTLRACGVLLRAGFSAAAERAFGERVLDVAHKAGRLHLLDLAKGCLRAEGREPVVGSREELVKAAFSTVGLPAALGLAGEKVLLDAYQQSPATWRTWCKVVSVASFRDHTVLRPSFLGGFERVAPAGEIKHGSITEESVAIKAATFGKLLSIDRTMLVNDDAGAFGQAAAALGKAAARKLADLVVQTLLEGISTFFTEGRANLLDAPLSLPAVASAVALLRSQVDADGDNLDIIPRVLLVGPLLESAARAICESEFIQAAEGAPTGNSLRGVLVPVIEPRLANPSIAGASDTAWAVLGGPEDAPEAVAFLNGQETPTIEELGLQSEVDRLAMTWRCYHDFGTALVDFRAAVFSSGDGG